MLIILPVLIPLLTALCGLLVQKSSIGRRWFFGFSAWVQFGLAVYLVREAWVHGTQGLYLGNWEAPIGITLVLDMLSALMVSMATLMTLACTIYGFYEQKIEDKHPLRLPLIQLLLVGMNLSILTGDLFNLFVAFEVMLLASYALITLEADDWDVRQAFPYVAINIFGSALFLIGCGFTYGLFGSLSFADIALQSEQMLANGEGSPYQVELLALLMVFVFAIKAGAFPLYYWLPNSYPILPPALAGLFSGMLTKVGVYVLIRWLGTVMPHDLDFIYNVLVWVGIASMFFAVLGAVSRNFIRGILSFHIPSQIGFMLLAIGFFTPYAFAAGIFFLIHNIMAKGSLFLCGGVVTFLCGSDDLKKTGNLWVASPLIGVVFFLQAMSLAGLPPLSGFWGKYMIIREGMALGEYVLVGFALAASILTLFSMLKIWLASFWTENPEVKPRVEDKRWRKMTYAVGGIAIVSLFMGLGAQLFVELSMIASEHVLDRVGYAESILTGREFR